MVRLRASIIVEKLKLAVISTLGIEYLLETYRRLRHWNDQAWAVIVHGDKHVMLWAPMGKYKCDSLTPGHLIIKFSPHEVTAN